MGDLISIPGIGKTSLELLETAGFHNVESLAKAEVADVIRDLERANTVLKIFKRTPGRATIKKWIYAARDIVGVPEDSAIPAEEPADEPAEEFTEDPAEPIPQPVNYEQNPQVAAMLVSAPFAIPLPARILVENQLGVGDVPAAILLNRYAGDLDVKVDQRLPMNRQAKPQILTANYVKIAENATPRVEIDTSRMRSTDNMGEPGLKVTAVKTSPSNDRVALLRAPLEATNKGRSPQSRWYIRGVLHAHPVSIYLGALMTLVLMIMTPVAIMSAGLLLASKEMPGFSWVPWWFVCFPFLLLPLGFCYLIWGVNGNCRICGQKLFMHRPHLKNARAHRVTGLGYILPLCVHLLIFRWFRCTHCGTPVRLKK